MSSLMNAQSALEAEIRARLGIVPSFFGRAAGSTEALQQLWLFAKAAYFDNPFPSLLKQRLMVHLFRCSPCRYWSVRHVGLLIGNGFPAGDSTVKPHTVSEAIALLKYPLPTEQQVQSATDFLQARTVTMEELSKPGEAAELALFQAAAAVFVDPNESQPRDALRHALGPMASDALFQLIAFAQASQMWALTHPDITVEEDLEALLHQHPEVAVALRDAMAQKPITYRKDRQDSRHQEPSAVIRSDEKEGDVSRFLAMATHELRNPLAAVSAVSEVFSLSDLPDARLRKANKILQRQSHLMREMLDDLLEIARLARGEAEMTMRLVAIDSVVGDVIREHEEQLQDAEIRVKPDLPVTHTYVSADGTMLSQIFGCLLSDVSRTVKGPATLAASMELTADRVIVRFIDTGGGSDNTPAKPLFQTSGTVEGAKSHSPRLGLARAKMLADLQGASLEAFSAGSGKGVSYIFSMPLNLQTSRGHQGMPEEENVSGSALKVLVIEDNRDLAKLFCDLLEVMGCVTEVALNAKSGLDRAKKRAPDIVFCDLGLPGEKDGFDFAHDLRSTPELAHIPLIAVTGHSSDEDRRRASAAGFDRVFAKPIKFAEIQEVLNAFQLRARP